MFLLQAAAGLYLFLPLVGRRTAGVKFFRLILVVCASLVACAAVAHAAASRSVLAAGDIVVVSLVLFLWLVLRYPTRLVFKAAVALLAAGFMVLTLVAYHQTVEPPSLAWSIAGALSGVGILGSVNLAMILGHWYLVVRGMPIEPLKRLTWATLAGTLVKLIVVAAALFSVAGPGIARATPLWTLFVADGIFFWMRVGWGLLVPLLLFPMIWGTVKIRSTMAATGILYVAVVAVVIGEVLGTYLSGAHHLTL